MTSDKEYALAGLIVRLMELAVIDAAADDEDLR